MRGRAWRQARASHANTARNGPFRSHASRVLEASTRGGGASCRFRIYLSEPPGTFKNFHDTCPRNSVRRCPFTQPWSDSMPDHRGHADSRRPPLSFRSPRNRRRGRRRHSVPVPAIPSGSRADLFRSAQMQRLPLVLRVGAPSNRHAQLGGPYRRHRPAVPVTPTHQRKMSEAPLAGLPAPSPLMMARRMVAQGRSRAGPTMGPSAIRRPCPEACEQRSR